MLNKTTKHEKYSKDWNNLMKVFVGKEIETKLTELNTISQELKDKLSAKEDFKNAYKHKQGTKREKTRLETVITNGNDVIAKSNQFKTAWQTNGWDKKSQDFYKDVKDNIYKAKIGTTDIETTEEQIINTVARVVSAFDKVDVGDFVAKYNAKETDTTKRKTIKDALDLIKGWGAEIVIGSDKDGKGNAKQRTYDFANTYEKGKWDDTTNKWVKDTTTPWTATNQFDYQQFGEFLELVKATDFLNDLDAAKQKDVPQTEDWKIFLKGAKYRTQQLKDYGIIIDGTKTTLYKTDSTKSQIFKVENGIKGWISLAQAVLTKENYERLNKSFTDANNPNQLLFKDGKTYDPTTSPWIFPESLNSLDDLILELEVEKASKASEIKQADIDTKTKELEQKETEIEAEFKKAITAKRAELKKLVPDLSKGKTFNKVSDTEDYRQTYTDLDNIQRLLLQIRYLENSGDCSLDSSVTDENTALTALEARAEKISTGTGSPCESEWFNKTVIDLRRYFIKNVSSGTNQIDYEHGISKIKEIYAVDPHYYFNKFKELYEWHLNLAKLEDVDEQFYNRIKQELGENPTPPQAPEKLTDWQTKLKALDPLLTETVITAAKKQDFEKHQNFQKVAEVEKLLKKVLDTDKKLKADFKTFLKADDATIDDLAQAITKYDARKMITLILKYEYNNLPDTGSTEQERQKTQQKRRLAKALNKTSESEITEAEITTTLFEIATGAKTIDSTKYYSADLTEISTPLPRPNDNNNNTTPQPWYAWGCYFPLWGTGILVLGITGAVIYWAQICKWWNGPTEEAGVDNDPE